MSDVNSLSEVDDFKNLQKRLNHEAIRQQFRSKLVGGLNEDDVTAYIEDIEEKLRKLEQENKKVSDDMYSLKNKFNKELEDKYDLQENLNKTQNDLDTYIAECKNKELIIQSLNEKASSEREQLHNEINQITEERKELEKLLNESGMEVEQMRNYAAGFKEDNSVMIAKIADLEKENLEIAKLNNEIHQMSEERKTLEELLAKSGMEIEQVKKCAAEFEEDNSVMKAKIVELEKENLKIAQMNNEIHQMSEEKKTLDELLSKYGIEVEEVKKCAAEFEEDNCTMKAKIADLEKENLKIAVLNNEIYQMSEERKTLEELLAKSGMEIEQVKKYAAEMSEERETLEELFIESSKEVEQLKKCTAEFEENNNVMKLRIADLEKESLKVAQLNNEILQMTEERKMLEELLNESSVEIEQVKICAAEFEENNNVMKARIAGLEKEIVSKNIQNEEINKACKNLEQQLNDEKSCNEKQSNDLAMFSQKIKDLEEAITEKLMEIKEQRKKNEQVELELNMEKARVLSYKINGFKDEFANIYKKIENLSDESNQYSRNNNELQQQLLAEQLRADKAEKDFTELSAVFTSLKEKYYNEFNPYDNQFKQIVEQRNQLQPEKINDWLIKLK